MKKNNPIARHSPLNISDILSKGNDTVLPKDALALLQKRAREQSCMYKISNLDEHELSIDNLLSETVHIIPDGWNYPEVAAVSIEYGGKKYITPNYAESKWMMSEKAEIRTGIFLVLTVVYLEKRPTRENGPFLEEEWFMMDFIVKQLSQKINFILSRQELEEEQQLLDKAYHLAHIGTWEFDMKTQDLTWSPITKEVHGFDHDYVPDLESTIRLFKEGINRETFRKAAMDAIEKYKPFDVELKIISGRGDERWIRATGEPEFKDGICTRFYGISQDVSVRRQAEENLQLSEQRFKSLVQDGSDLLAILDSKANYLYVSPTSESILGIKAENFIGTNALDYIHEDDKARINELLSKLSPNQRISIPPYRFKDAENNWRWIETTLTDMTEDPAVGGLVANSRDVTEQINQQQQNMESLKEKETLLSEIHHRVKNNLAVVSGMMQLQAMEEENSAIKERLFDSISRIKTMANIHEQLYKSKSFSKLDLADNIHSLVSDIKKTFRSNTEINIDFDCKFVQMNINQALPCSQIVNEVVTNIFKHAFPGQKKGNITFSLNEKEDNQVFLTIRDNGIGMSENLDKTDKNSLGLKLIRVLARQLKATYQYESYENGTLFILHFKKDEIKGIGNINLK